MSQFQDSIIMGIVNATPDSFYDGGAHSNLVAHALSLIDAGATWIDIGGESTRPGAHKVSVNEECDRVLPVIESLAPIVHQRNVDRIGQPLRISIDTTKAEVARAAAAAGATILNDVKGLQSDALAETTSLFDICVLMHSRGTPKTMQQLTTYNDLVSEIYHWLSAQSQRCKSAEIYFDPGIGFAKTTEQSLKLLQQAAHFLELGPVLIGASRKSVIGRTLDQPNAEDRLIGSLAVVAACYARGIRAFRVHDVSETKELLEMLRAIKSA